jgi:hypothetical protein
MPQKFCDIGSGWIRNLDESGERHLIQLSRCFLAMDRSQIEVAGACHAPVAPGADALPFCVVNPPFLLVIDRSAQQYPSSADKVVSGR